MYKKSRKAGGLSHLFLLVLAEEVGGPVGDVEEGEDQGERDARDDVDTFRASRELGQPRAAETRSFRLLHVYLTVHLLHGKWVPVYQRLLEQKQPFSHPTHAWQVHLCAAGPVIKS